MKKFLFGLMTALTVFAACSKDDKDVQNITFEKTTYVGEVTVVEPYYVKSDVKVNVVPSAEAEGVLDIEMIRVNFAEAMKTEIDFTIPAVPYTVKDGVVSFGGEGIIPTVRGNEFPKFTVTGMTGTIKGDKIDFSLNFGTYPTKYTGTVISE